MTIASRNGGVRISVHVRALRLKVARATGNQAIRPEVTDKVDLTNNDDAARTRLPRGGPIQVGRANLAGKAAHSSADAPVPLEPSDLYRARP